MKEKILHSIKRVKQKKISIRMLVFSTLYLFCIMLSLKSDLLFFKEILACGFIIYLLLLNVKIQNSSK